MMCNIAETVLREVCHQLLVCAVVLIVCSVWIKGAPVFKIVLEAIEKIRKILKSKLTH